MNKLLIVFFSLLVSQGYQDARMLGLGGAYTTLSSGYRAVGVNPANINNGTNWTVNVFSSTSVLSNNFLNIDRYNEINGAHFDNPLASSYYPKEKIQNILQGEGIQLNVSSINLIPGLNFSKDNYAFTSNMITYGDIKFPQAFVDIMFFGNPVGKELDMAFNQSMIAALETGFTYCKEIKQVNIGLTGKYLQGIYYSNMEQLGNAYFKTDTTAFLGNGNYLIKQGLGGSGFAFDIGFSTSEFENGVRFGASIINAFSSMEWNKNTPLRKGLEDIGVDFPVREKEYFFFNFTVDSLNAQTLLTATAQDLFQTDTYKASIINFESIPVINPLDYNEADLPLFYIDSNNESDIVSSDISVVDPSRVVVLEDGRVIIPTEYLSDEDLELFNSSPFKTDYPTFLRFGFSKNFYKEDILLAIDITTGLDDMFYNEEKWKFSLGAEINKNPKIPIRLGVSLGGKDKFRYSFGTGYSFGAMKIDFAYGYIGSFKSSSARGLDLSFNVFYDYVESDKEELTFIDKIKEFFVSFYSKYINKKNDN